MLLDGDGIVRAALDGAVVGDNHAGDALDDAHAGDDAARRHLGLRVQLVAGHGRQLEKGGARVDEGGDAVARQHLLAREMLVAGLLRAALLDGGGQALQARGDVGHLGLIVLELGGGRVNVCGEAGDCAGLVGRGEGCC